MNQVDFINSLEGALVVEFSAFPAEEAPEELFGNVKLNPKKIKINHFKHRYQCNVCPDIAVF